MEINLPQKVLAFVRTEWYMVGVSSLDCALMAGKRRLAVGRAWMA